MRAPSTTASDFDSCRARSAWARATSLLLLLVCLVFAFLTGSAHAELSRTTPVEEFGPDGTSATSFPGKVANLDFNEEDDQLIVMTEEPREIFTFDVNGPGDFTPVPGGHFPVGGTGFKYGMAVAPFTGNVYVASMNGGLFGYTRTGTPLANFPVTGFPLTADFPSQGEVCGVSVNSEGDLFVAEQTHYRIEVLDAATGEPLRGISVFPHCRIQVDRANDDVYIADLEGGASRLLYNHDYAQGINESVEIGGGGFGDFAVDPITRNLLASANPGFSGAHEFQEFSRTNTVASNEPDGPVNVLKFGSPVEGVAAGSDGTAYLGVGDKVAEIPYAPIPAVETREPIASSEVSGFVDPAAEGDITRCYFQWGESSDYWLNTNQTPCAETLPYAGPREVTAQLPGLTLGQTYHYRVVAGNASYGGLDYGEDETITPPLVADLKTEAATSVTRNGATLSASLTGNGSATTYYFKWGQSAFYGNTAPSPPPAEAGTPTGHTPLSVPISGLQPNTTYHYRVVATNSAGTSEGLDKTFTTQGFVVDTTTKPATGLSQESVTLNGEFFGTGEEVTYYFEWGPTSSYGNKVPGAPASAGEPNGPTQVSAQLTEFEASNTYHYRLVATNALGTSYGQDETFASLPAQPPSISNPRVSSVEFDSATFGADITPNRRSTIYLFEYGPTPAYGSFTAVGGPIPGVSGDLESISVHATDLIPGTVYHYRAIATNFAGTTYGPDQTFLTPGPPEVGAPGVAAVTPNSADVEAFVRPNLRDTTVHVEYGRTQAYGAVTAESGSIGGDEAQHLAGAKLSGLTPSTTYHFRVVATNGLGSTVSTDGIFTTQPALFVAPSPVVKRKKCKRGFVKRRGRCVKKKHRRHHHSSSDRAHRQG